MKINIDFETYSDIDISEVGAWTYSRHPSTRVLCMAIQKEGDVFPELYTDKSAIVEQLMFALNSGFRGQKTKSQIHAYNSFFECCIIFNTLGFTKDLLDFSMWRDTMAAAMASTFPAALGKACAAIGLPEDKQKDKAGKDLIRKLCKPQKLTTKKDSLLISPREKWDDKYDELFDALCDYCMQDVTAEIELSEKLLPLSADEQKIWEQDQAINWRGMKIDFDLCGKGLHMYEETKQFYLDEIQSLTGLDNPNSRAQVQKWVEEQGVELPNMQAATVREAVQGDLPEDVKAVLELRLMSSRTPPTKFKKLMAMADPDDHRIRGLLTYHGATTGRWASRGINTQNLPRPSLKDFDMAIDLIKNDGIDGVRAFLGDPIDVLCSVIRPSLTASEGCSLYVPDYSSIESRALNWVAGADDTIEKIRQGDAEGDSSRVYKIAAEGVFGLPAREVQKGSNEYQGGKATELACGYQGSFAALASMSNSLGIDIVVPHNFYFPSEYRGSLEWHNKRRSKRKEDWLSEKEKYMLYLVKRWREANPRIVEFWKNAENCAIAAVQNPGREMKVNSKVSFKAGARKGNNYLWCKLPSGRLLTYVNPYLKEDKEFGLGLRFWAVDSTTRQWRRHHTHGGVLTENIVQAIARDFLAYGKLRLSETEHFDNVVLSVHDEFVNDVPDSYGANLDDLCDVICTLEPWMKGLPMKAAGDITRRYWK